MRQWQSLHSCVECLRVTHLPQEGRPGHMSGASLTRTTKRFCIGVVGGGGGNGFEGHCRTPLHGGMAGKAS